MGSLVLRASGVSPFDHFLNDERFFAGRTPATSSSCCVVAGPTRREILRRPPRNRTRRGHDPPTTLQRGPSPSNGAKDHSLSNDERAGSRATLREQTRTLPWEEETTTPLREGSKTTPVEETNGPEQRPGSNGAVEKFFRPTGGSNGANDHRRATEHSLPTRSSSSSALLKSFFGPRSAPAGRSRPLRRKIFSTLPDLAVEGGRSSSARAPVSAPPPDGGGRRTPPQRGVSEDSPTPSCRRQKTLLSKTPTTIEKPGPSRARRPPGRRPQEAAVPVSSSSPPWRDSSSLSPGPVFRRCSLRAPRAVASTAGPGKCCATANTPKISPTMEVPRQKQKLRSPAKVAPLPSLPAAVWPPYARIFSPPPLAAPTTPTRSTMTPFPTYGNSTPNENVLPFIFVGLYVLSGDVDEIQICAMWAKEPCGEGDAHVWGHGRGTIMWRGGLWP